MTVTDLAELALLARTALAEPESVTLHIRDLPRPPSGDAPAVLLHDDDGHPTFLCEPGSPVPPAAARGCTAQLTVVHPRATHDRLSVLVEGRLFASGAEDVDGTRVDIVRLRLYSVLVEFAARGDLVQRVVPLELYRSASPDPLRCWAARMVEHTNTAHQDRLRHCVARRHDLRFDDVLAASVAALDPSGAVLHWIDLDGAHTMNLAFAAEARDATQLAESLRESIARPGRLSA